MTTKVVMSVGGSSIQFKREKNATLLRISIGRVGTIWAFECPIEAPYFVYNPE